MKIIATTRQAQGTGASRRLRRADKLPGIVYGGNSNTILFSTHYVRKSSTPRF